MTRFFVWVLILLVGAAVLAERFPALHDRVPWLPLVPGLGVQGTATPRDASATAEGKASGTRSGGKRSPADGPVPVLVAEAAFTDVPVTVDILGTVQATNSVLVRSQVDGKLIEVDFKEGQDVRKGDVVARIDPAIYKAAYDQAVAKKAQDDALLSNGQVDLVRYQKLAETQYGSHQQADTQRALVAQYAAQVQQDQASIDNTKATFDYATVRAPIDGRTGIRQVDEGNIVHASDTTGIVTIAQVKPIAVIFNLPQQWLRQVNGAVSKGTLKLEARDGGGGAVLDTGTLQVVDNAIDQTTGTVKLKGSFPNANAQVWPGQFVNIRLYVDTLSHVVAVPTPAVQRGPDGAFVYVVQGQSVVQTKVMLGRQDETQTVLASGLVPPATVVTTGFSRLTDGGKVSVSTPPAAAASADTQAASTGEDTETDADAVKPAAATDEPSQDAAKQGKSRHRRKAAGAASEATQ